ncbi:hypothetical protein LPICM17_400001 [Lactococcus piscium]|nr:hypothetical protein LPICM17_400001 [Lactococcus piscium]
MRDGEISFRDTSAWKPNSREKYGGIGYNNFPGGIWSGAVSGISVRGNEGWAIGTSNSDVGGTEATKGSLIAGGLERATFAAKKQITITAGDVYKNSIFSAPPAIQVGTGNSSNEILISSKLTTIGDVLVSELRVDRKATISQSLTANSLNVTGSKNAIHATRNGVRATPAYETAESYLGDIGSNYTREDCEVWIDIDKLFSDTVNTDIAYQVFLQAYDDTKFWVADFKSDKFLIKSDKPLSRFAWEIKAKRRGYENDRLVLQDDFDNEKIEEAWREK